MGQDSSDTNTGSLSPSLRFETQPYHPDGGFTVVGVFLVFGVSTLTAIVLAYTMGFIGRWFYLVLLFPAGMGLLLGAAGAAAVGRGKLRNSKIAFLAAVVGALITILGIHYLEYRRFLGFMNGQQPGLGDRLEAQGLSGFYQHVDLRARLGVRLTSGHGVGNGGAGLNLGYYGSYIYWAVELALVAGVAGLLMTKKAAEPFCTECNSWKQARNLGRFDAPSVVVIDAVETGEIVRLAEYDLHQPAGRLEIGVAVCPNCVDEKPVEIQIREITKNKKGEEKKQTLAQVSYPGQVLPVLESLFKPNEPAQSVARND